MAPAGTKTPGCKKGHGSRDGTKPLKRRWKAARFSKKAQERNEERELFFDHRAGDKALKGEAYERWGLKEASKGSRAKETHIERVAKP